MRFEPLKSGLALALFALATACGTPETRPGDSSQPGDDPATTTPVVINGTVGETVNPDSIAGRAPAARTIYFDFDTAEIRSEYLSTITEHGRYLAANPDGRVRLEGHTDERGTREYNIALGEYRSKAVARMLQLQGVSSAQLRTISFGEELPDSDGHTPADWDKNRRVIIVYEVEQ